MYYGYPRWPLYPAIGQLDPLRRGPLEKEGTGTVPFEYRRTVPTIPTIPTGPTPPGWDLNKPAIPQLRYPHPQLIESIWSNKVSLAALVDLWTRAFDFTLNGTHYDGSAIDMSSFDGLYYQALLELFNRAKSLPGKVPGMSIFDN